MEKEKLSLSELRERTDWNKAVIVITNDSFGRDYNEHSRSYEIRRTDKYFEPNAIGSALIGNCLDGTDPGVRLDNYLSDSWKEEFCYIIS